MCVMLYGFRPLGLQGLTDIAEARSAGRLYVVATPIGNLADFSPRATATLKQVALIAAEDTRHTGRLLSHFGVSTPQMALHDHNEAEVHGTVLDRLRGGDDVALVSDAGTPLISDPGYRLVHAAAAAAIDVVAVPGPSAVTAALSVSGLAVDQFVFIGFLPARDEARLRALGNLVDEQRTTVAFESVHRIGATLDALAGVLQAERRLSVHREITKQFESVYRGTATALAGAFADGSIVAKGEFVIVIEGASASDDAASSVDVDRLLTVLLRFAPLKSAVAAAQELTGLPRNRLYQRALALAGPD